jgi:stage III sporulation protein AG
MELTAIAQWLNTAFAGYDYAILQALHNLAGAAGGFFTPLCRAITLLGEKGILFLVLGIVLMLLPGGNAEAEPTAGSPDAEAFDRGAVQEEMENILRAIDGVGELRLMLTVDSGTKRELAQDTTAERSGSEDMKRKSETVVVGTGSGTQEVVVTNRVYPRYVGALVVCEGGGSAGVRLAVTQAVSALTALPSDKITVLQGKP